MLTTKSRTMVYSFMVDYYYNKHHYITVDTVTFKVPHVLTNHLPAGELCTN